MRSSIKERLERIEKSKKKGRILFKTPGRFTDTGEDVWIYKGEIIPEPPLREDDIVFIDDIHDIDEETREKYKNKLVSRIKAGAILPEETEDQRAAKKRIMNKINSEN